MKGLRACDGDRPLDHHLWVIWKRKRCFVFTLYYKNCYLRLDCSLDGRRLYLGRVIQSFYNFYFTTSLFVRLNTFWQLTYSRLIDLPPDSWSPSVVPEPLCCGKYSGFGLHNKPNWFSDLQSINTLGPALGYPRKIKLGYWYDVNRVEVPFGHINSMGKQILQSDHFYCLM